MQALRYYGKLDLRLEELPIPEVKENQVKVNNIDILFYFSI